MSGDHNMNQTDSGWRKRQIALDIKAKNARELGLDYEPSKTVLDMAREAGFADTKGVVHAAYQLEAFAALVRVESFKEIAEKVKEMPWENDTKDSFLIWLKEQA